MKFKTIVLGILDSNNAKDVKIKTFKTTENVELSFKASKENVRKIENDFKKNHVRTSSMLFSPTFKNPGIIACSGLVYPDQDKN